MQAKGYGLNHFTRIQEQTYDSTFHFSLYAEHISQTITLEQQKDIVGISYARKNNDTAKYFLGRMIITFPQGKPIPQEKVQYAISFVNSLLAKTHISYRSEPIEYLSLKAY